jgi:hypothetical protein
LLVGQGPSCGSRRRTFTTSFFFALSCLCIHNLSFRKCKSMTNVKSKARHLIAWTWRHFRWGDNLSFNLKCFTILYHAFLESFTEKSFGKKFSMRSQLPLQEWLMVPGPFQKQSLRHFADMTICQHDNSPTWQFTNMTIHQHDNSPTWQFAALTVHQHDNLPTWQFADITIHQQENSPNWQFANMTIH